MGTRPDALGDWRGHRRGGGPCGATHRPLRRAPLAVRFRIASITPYKGERGLQTVAPRTGRIRGAFGECRSGGHRSEAQVRSYKRSGTAWPRSPSQSRGTSERDLFGHRRGFQPHYRKAVTEIDTPRLHLRPLNKDDQPLFVQLFAEPRVTRYLVLTDDPMQPEWAVSALDRNLACWERYGYGPFAAIHKESGRWIGRIGLMVRGLGG